MARIRSVKPEMNTSDSFNRLSDSAQIFMVKLYTECDDSGRVRWLPKKLVGNLYPLREDVDTKRLEALVSELEREVIFLRYTIDGQAHGCFPNWDDHQKISNPTASKLPPPQMEAIEEFRTREGNSPEELQKVSVPGTEVQPTGTGNRDKGTGNREREPGVKKEKPKTSVEPAEFPAELETPECRKSVSEWIEHRKQIREPATPLAISKLLKQWAVAGPAAFVAAIDHSIANGWTGVFAPKDRARDGPANQTPAASSSAMKRNTAKAVSLMMGETTDEPA